MARQLNIRSDEAYETARRLAARLNTTTHEVIVKALRRYEAESTLPPAYDDLTAGQKASVDRILAEAERIRQTLPDGITSDHSDMYDGHGLPR